MTLKMAMTQIRVDATGLFRPIVIVFIVAAIACATSTPVSAQWLQYPTAGVPKLPSGRPNLSAPAPRTRDGRPDLSGVWEPEKNRTCPPEGCFDMLSGEQFFNIGWGLKDGLPYRPWAADTRKVRMAENGKDDPVSRCLPGGVVKLHTTPLLRKIIQVPGLVVSLNETDATYRQIFTDGRPLPVDPEPSWKGYSSGKWDGDTLVVESNGFRDGLWLDRSGSPLTDAAKLTERFRRVNYGKLEIEITVDDPKAYAAPWTVKLNQFIALDTDLLDYICVENEKDVKHLVGR
jgi:hypothetical protein